MKDYYEVLGVERDAEAAEIKRAYFKLVRQYPPERFPEEFKEIRAAYDTLSDAERRAEFDKFGELPPGIAIALQQAIFASDDEQYAVATNIFCSILMRYPDLSSVKAEYGKSLVSEGKSGKAIKVFEELCKSDQQNIEYRILLANAYFVRGWNKKAISEFEQLLEMDCSNIEAWITLIGYYFQSGDFNRSKETCLKAIATLREKEIESISIYAFIAIHNINSDDDEDSAENYMRKIVALLNESGSKYRDEEEEFTIVMTILIACVMELGKKELISYLHDIMDLLPRVKEQFEEELEYTIFVDELESIEKEGFGDIFHDYIAHCYENCDCEDCREERIAIELNFIMDRGKYGSKILRLKKTHPNLYAVCDSFFDELLRTTNPDKMARDRVRKLHKTGFQLDPRPKKSNAFDDFPNWEDVDPFSQPVKRDESIVGRNDPCPCGSGKKYKKCCGKGA